MTELTQYRKEIGFFPVILFLLTLSHFIVYLNGYLNHYQLVILILADITLILPMLFWDKTNNKILYIISSFIILTLDFLISNLYNMFFFLMLNMTIFLIPIFIKNTKFALLYVILAGYGVQFFVNTNMFLMDDLNIHYSPSTLLLILYVPLLKKLKIECLFPQEERGVFILIIIVSGLAYQLVNPFGLTIITTYLINAIREEIVFRAWLLKELKTISNINYINIFISSMVFTLIHITNYVDMPLIWALVNLVVIFLMGIIYAFIYQKRNNIINVSLVHMIYNVFMLNIKGV